MKTEQTKKIEEYLYKQCWRKGKFNDLMNVIEFGCTEVGLYMSGVNINASGKELVDFLTMNKFGELTCYEIKISFTDLNSKSKKSWYGDYNYLVVGKDLDEELKKKSNPYDLCYFNPYKPQWVGYIVVDTVKGIGKVVVQAEKQDMSYMTRDILKTCLIKTMFYKNVKDQKY